ncbi:hypothetical protein B6N60_02899 [Richelia sinica FACHB-800]|uniref:DUF3122 domain-containing protein n=1 Tax=Richelia sinica FACHB-800 TaxID=1357546 RepID=A0A975Y5F8_9NOST|nr:DUF3122 domain-containing protein [Richelia sinica]MBD2666562.1 DUF3122 domain-containing protein [Richelia sinica FACHB-800]QXE24195.1 hypothetical protein B6N60_02899 [Richelia sinica FACHB-800]
MLRHLGKILWLISLGMLTLSMFLGLGNLPFTTAIAAVARLEPTPGEILYRSQLKLDDQFGHVWQVVLFKNVGKSPQTATINLRLVGFPGSAELIHPQALKIISPTGQIWNAADVFLDEAPAPTIGQYDFREILPQLPQEKLTLEIPLVNKEPIKISVPLSVVTEWQSIINTNY